jgi:mRNA interferase RelE/StbE
LDNSIVEIIDKKLSDLEKRAEDIGKPLSGNLYGYREIKLRDAGIRIIYEVLREESSRQDVVYILTIQKRDKNLVFESATQRIRGK